MYCTYQCPATCVVMHCPLLTITINRILSSDHWHYYHYFLTVTVIIVISIFIHHCRRVTPQTSVLSHRNRFAEGQKGYRNIIRQVTLSTLWTGTKLSYLRTTSQVCRVLYMVAPSFPNLSPCTLCPPFPFSTVSSHLSLPSSPTHHLSSPSSSISPPIFPYTVSPPSPQPCTHLDYLLQVPYVHGLRLHDLQDDAVHIIEVGVAVSGSEGRGSGKTDAVALDATVPRTCNIARRKIYTLAAVTGKSR